LGLDEDVVRVREASRRTADGGNHSVLTLHVARWQLRAWESSELSKESDSRFTEDDFVHSTPQRLLSLARYNQSLEATA
jgi:hypothetical protein